MNLNCENFDSAVHSICEILKLDRKILFSRLGAIPETAYAVNEDANMERRLPMLNNLVGRIIENDNHGCTYWFHATRVKEATSFCSGIRPLADQIGETWKSLYPLVSDRISPQDWNAFRQETERDNYGHSSMVIKSWKAQKGPFAFLFADSALNMRRASNHSYLKTSELVEFIAICFEKKYRIDLAKRHHASTSPFLITFVTPGVKALHLGAALDYVLHCIKSWPIACIDPIFAGNGKGVTTPQLREAIPVAEVSDRSGKTTSFSLSSNNARFEFNPESERADFF